jgi:hypothetical protein
MTFLSFYWLFGLLGVLHEILDLNFKLDAFVVNGLIKGEIEKPSHQWLVDLARFEFKSGTVHLFYLYLCFIGESCVLVS